MNTSLGQEEISKSETALYIFHILSIKRKLNPFRHFLAVRPIGAFAGYREEKQQNLNLLENKRYSKQFSMTYLTILSAISYGKEVCVVVISLLFELKIFK